MAKFKVGDVIINRWGSRFDVGKIRKVLQVTDNGYKAPQWPNQSKMPEDDMWEFVHIDFCYEIEPFNQIREQFNEDLKELLK